MQTSKVAQQAKQNQSQAEAQSPQALQPQFDDCRPEGAAQLRMQSLMANSAQSTQLKSMQAMMASNTPAKNFGKSHSPQNISSTSDKTLQRAVSESHHNADDNRAAALEYENALDQAVQRAHHHVIAAPNLGDLADLDGHTAKWVEDWQAAVHGNAPGSLATSFGYAIETLATMVYLPAAPAGMSHQLQGVRNNTRPDVILMNEAGDVSWLDITASASAGHIWNKDGWGDRPHVSEVTYPSLQPQHRQLMAQNNDVVNPAGFDAAAFADQLAQATALRDFRRERWAELGNNIREAYWALPAVANISAMLANLSPMLHRQNPLLGLLIDRFNLGINPPPGASQVLTNDGGIVDTAEIAQLRRMAPNILRALGLGSAPFGFIGGGALAGEAWLLHNDPNLAQPADLPQAVEDDDEGGGGEPQQAVAAMEE